MKEFIIGKDDANQRVDKFILKTMKTMPKSLMYKYIRNKKIKVNCKRCEISQRLMEGDRVQCYISDEFFVLSHSDQFLQVPSHVDIVYEDDQFLIMNKPSGLLVHSDQKEVQDNLHDRMLHYLYDAKIYDPSLAQSFTPALCHRIDRNTQGLVIGAKSAEALRKMNEKIRNREVEKKYLCIVEGHFERKTGEIIAYHRKGEDNKALISREEKAGYQKVKTAYRLLDEKKGYSLLEVDLLTGKSHQIRSVMAYLHHPLYGDVKYGAAKTKEKKYQALCAYKLYFAFAQEEGLQNIAGKCFTLKENDVITLWNRL